MLQIENESLDCVFYRMVIDASHVSRSRMWRIKYKINYLNEGDAFHEQTWIDCDALICKQKRDVIEEWFELCLIND